jgi:hypothetical protein
MPTAYIITATVILDDNQRNIVSGQTVYGSNFYWVGQISGAIWYESRQEAVEIIAGDIWDERHQYLMSGSNNLATKNWTISQIDYEISNVMIGDDERDAVVRKNALKRLSEDERRVLGIR